MPLEVEWDAAKYDSGEGQRCAWHYDDGRHEVALDTVGERCLLSPLHDVNSFPQPVRKFEEQAGTCNSAVECQSILN